MDDQRLEQTRMSLHQINNDLSVAAMALETISIKLERSDDTAFAETLGEACGSALDAVRRAGRNANRTLHDLSES